MNTTSHRSAFMWSLWVSLSVAWIAGLSMLKSGRAWADGSQPKTLRAVVSIPPLKGLTEEFARSAAGERFTVESLLPVGVSEHGYEIPPRRLASLAQADIVVYVGRGLEPQVEKFLAEHPRPERQVVVFAGIVDRAAQKETADLKDHGAATANGADTSSPAADAPGKDVPAEKKDHAHHHAHDHDDGDDCAAGCSHGDLSKDPHLWLDPLAVEKLVPELRLAVEQAWSLKGELSSDAKARLEATEKSMLARVRRIHEGYAANVAKAENKTIVVAHDAYGHMAHRYGIETAAIAGLHAGEPKPSDIERAIKAIRDRGAKVVYVEPQLSTAAGNRVAKATKAKVLVLDPVGGDSWFKTMDDNLNALLQGLGVKRE